MSDMLLGQHAEAIRNLEKAVDESNKQMQLLSKTVHELQLTIESAKGGWKVLIAVGTISGFFGAVATKIWPIISER